MGALLSMGGCISLHQVSHFRLALNGLNPSRLQLLKSVHRVLQKHLNNYLSHYLISVLTVLAIFDIDEYYENFDQCWKNES